MDITHIQTCLFKMKNENPSRPMGSGERLTLPNTQDLKPDCAVVFTFKQEEEDWKISSVHEDDTVPEQRVVRLLQANFDSTFICPQ